MPDPVSFDASMKQFPEALDRLLSRSAQDLPAVLLVAGAKARARGWAAPASVAIAQGLALRGQRVVLCDLCFQEPELDNLLGLVGEEGMADLLLFGASMTRVARPVPDQAFHFVAAGTAVSDRELLESPKWSRLLAGFGKAEAVLVGYVAAEEVGVEKLAGRFGHAVILATEDEREDIIRLVAAECTVEALLCPPEASPEGESQSEPRVTGVDADEELPVMDVHEPLTQGGRQHPEESDAAGMASEEWDAGEASPVEDAGDPPGSAAVIPEAELEKEGFDPEGASPGYFLDIDLSDIYSSVSQEVGEQSDSQSRDDAITLDSRDSTEAADAWEVAEPADDSKTVDPAGAGQVLEQEGASGVGSSADTSESGESADASHLDDFDDDEEIGPVDLPMIWVPEEDQHAGKSGPKLRSGGHKSDPGSPASPSLSGLPGKPGEDLSGEQVQEAMEDALSKMEASAGGRSSTAPKRRVSPVYIILLLAALAFAAWWHGRQLLSSDEQVPEIYPDNQASMIDGELGYRGQGALHYAYPFVRTGSMTGPGVYSVAYGDAGEAGVLEEWAGPGIVVALPARTVRQRTQALEEYSAPGIVVALQEGNGRRTP